MELYQIFDSKGNFATPFDPHRDREDPRFDFLFNEDGNLKAEHVWELRDLVRTNLQWSHFCEATSLWHAQRFASNTKGQYSAIYYWR